MAFPYQIKNLIRELTKLPGIGPKAAWRASFWLLANPTELAEAITEIKKIKPDSRCRSLICFCDSPKRDKTKLCVVENDMDLVALERSGSFLGLYHIIGDALDPNIKPLLEQIKNLKNLKEIILALSPSTEGDMLAFRIKKEIERLYPKIKITRIARGLPTGADIEYADEKTLESAMANRS